MSTLPSAFHPVIRSWFASEIGEPTPIQTAAWPRIGAGEHVLVTAPTGSGKTLAAFLWALDRLFTGAWTAGATRALYVTPVKALGTDISRNLRHPLERLTHLGHGEGWAAPPRVAIRSGDTPQSERRRMARTPPEILITTPESLNLMLTSRSGRRMLAELETVILDEVHAVVGGKRGVHLITAVERLTRQSGEIQRIGLSATVEPTDRVAAWIGGRALIAPGVHRERPVVTVSSDERKAIEVRVESTLSRAPAAPRDRDEFWQNLAIDLRREISRHRSTLVFANSRRMVERVARLINEGAGDHLAWSHHGALSHEIRQVVEQRLKDGALRAIVATNSLELGIDVGAVDHVILIQSPPSVASTLQRVGRSGHAVGATSSGRLYPLHPRDLLQCTVSAEAALAGDLEPIRPVTGALDVLAQVLLSMTVATTWNLDELYDAIRCADPYRALPRRHFDLVVDMLSGRYANVRLGALNPMVSLDRMDGTIQARPGVERRLYLSGGTIPDRGYYTLRIQEANGARLGELDEEFVWERSVGDTFSLGVQSWRVEAVTHSDVLVSPAPAAAAMAPFWRADERDGSHHMGLRLARRLEELETGLDDEDLSRRLVRTAPLSPTAADQLVEFLRAQTAATGQLPHRHRVLVEHGDSSRGRSGERQIFLHTLWGGQVNRTLGLVFRALWKADHGTDIAVAHDEDCVVLSVPADAVVDDPLAAVTPSRIHDLVRTTLATTGAFGARFREAAGIALLLPRAGPNRRTPLWLHRQRAKDLLEGLREADDFPLVLEAWRATLEDGLDLSSLEARLNEIADGDIEVVCVRTTRPSPFAAHVLWRQTNELMYDDDRPGTPGGHSVRSDLLSDLVLSSGIRHLVSPDLVSELESKLARLAPGYSPAPGRDLVDWIVERTLLTAEEWTALSAAVCRDHDVTADVVAESVRERVVRLPAPPLVLAAETLPRVSEALGLTGPAADDLLGHPAEIDPPRHPAPQLSAPEILRDRLRFRGPVEPEQLGRELGFSSDLLARAVEVLIEDGEIVSDQITCDATTPQLCHRENLERLLRLGRHKSRPSFQTRPVEELPLFLAERHGLALADPSFEAFQDAVEGLLGWPAPAEMWETELLPARSPDYRGRWLDSLLRDTSLEWVGCGERTLTLVTEGERPLLGLDGDNRVADEGLFPHRLGRFTLTELALHHERPASDIAESLWAAAWRGEVTADSFAPLRQAVETGFASGRQAESPSRPGRRTRRRARFQLWQSEHDHAGQWYPLAPCPSADDPLEREEVVRDRVRLLLDRHGLLFRSLVERELPALRWAAVFPALRLMELSGEVLGGRFFEGVPGLQFISPEAFRTLRRGLAADRIWWLAAVDPASPCALGLEGMPSEMPRRAAGNHLVYHGARLVLVSEATGRRLTVTVPPDHPALDEYLVVLRHFLTREVRPRRSLTIETVNGGPAQDSPYAPALARGFHVTRGPASLRLSRRL